MGGIRESLENTQHGVCFKPEYGKGEERPTDGCTYLDIPRHCCNIYSQFYLFSHIAANGPKITAVTNKCSQPQNAIYSQI